MRRVTRPSSLPPQIAEDCRTITWRDSLGHERILRRHNRRRRRDGLFDRLSSGGPPRLFREHPRSRKRFDLPEGGQLAVAKLGSSTILLSDQYQGGALWRRVLSPSPRYSGRGRRRARTFLSRERLSFSGERGGRINSFGQSRHANRRG